MEKEKLTLDDCKSRKKLPMTPVIPVFDNKPENDPVGYLQGFKVREENFFEALNESINLADKENNDMNADENVTKMSEEECRNYIGPLLGRTRESISTLLAAKDSLDQLDNLHRIVKRLLIIQEQNFQMRKRLATVRTLHALKSMEMQINNGDFRQSDEQSDFDMNEIEENMANIENIMAAATSASNKRISSKKLRSKSIISEDFKDNDRNYPLRRQSAISDFKPKVSKWTKVKAAFKWEKTNALSESKSSDSILSPNNSELARYLRVPPTPHGCSSGESVFSLSSGRVGTPPELSSSENEEEKNSRNRNSMKDRYHSGEDRRSHSLDGDGEPSKAVIEHQKYLNQLDKNKNKSTWNKVKMIVTNRTSRKSVKSSGSNNSRDVSPIENLEYLRDRADSLTSSPHYVGAYNLNIPDYDLCLMSSDDNESKPFDYRQAKTYRNSKKNKHIPEIESLPEGVPFEKSFKQKPIPKPLNLQQEKSEDEFQNPESTSPSPAVVTRIKKSSSSSVPNSPRQSEIFEFPTLQRGGSNSSRSSQQDEIIKNYQELQRKINSEFEIKKIEWQKIRPLVVQVNNALPAYCLSDDSSLPCTPKGIISNITLNEEGLSPDFKKKLDEWRTKKNQQSQKSSPKRPGHNAIPLPDPKDLPEGFQKKMNEWKQMKTEGRVPTYTNQTSVQERMKRQFSKNDSKSSSSSSMKKSKTYDDKNEGLYKLKSLVSEPAAKDVVVQTSKGTMVFQGISRKFTRKLAEWEKAKGIGPESSTIALLNPDYKITTSRQLPNCESNDRIREKSPMKRCLSVDSMKPLPNVGDFQMSHQPSSLSLNDVENFKENEKARRTVSSREINHPRDVAETESYDEPEALLVEIEDESFETLPPVPEPVVTPSGIPVFKFDFAMKDPKRDEADCVETLKEIFKALENGSNIILDFYKTNEIAITTIKYLTNIFKYINHSLIQLRESSKDYSSAFLFEALKLSNEIVNDFEKVDNSFNEKSILQNLPTINGKTLQLKDAVKIFESFFMENRDNSVKGFQAIRTIQSSEDDHTAVATVTPIFVCAVEENAVKAPPKRETSDKSGEETNPKKVVRNLSNGSKRKVRLRRMGSRQSSKTESDSENEQHLNQDEKNQRKVKRKTSRAKKPVEPEKIVDTVQGVEEKEVTYVFKIRPGEVNEMTTKPSDLVDNIVDPNEIASSKSCGNFTSAIIKTKRKIFTPVEVQDGAVKITFSQEIESSDKSENEKKLPQNSAETEPVKETVVKDLSPSIRLMIHRYNSNVDKNSSAPNSPGSVSPIWRSPILDRRVRKQSQDYQEKISKSLEIAREKIEIAKKEELEQQKSEEKKLSGEIQEEITKIEEKFNENLTLISEITSEEIELSKSLETLNEIPESKGAIPKETKAIDNVILPPVTMRNDLNKPRTPLSERAIKIRQAKEAFLKMPIVSYDSSQSDWSYRLSQISVGSTDTDETGSLNKSTGNNPSEDKFSLETKSLSLPRSSNASDIRPESTKSSRFGLSSIATKLRKVKLKRNAREVQKMHTVPVLCRASLAVDFSPRNGSDPLHLLPESNVDRNVKKSKSLGMLENP